MEAKVKAAFGKLVLSPCPPKPGYRYDYVNMGRGVRMRLYDNFRREGIAFDVSRFHEECLAKCGHSGNLQPIKIKIWGANYHPECKTPVLRLGFGAQEDT